MNIKTKFISGFLGIASLVVALGFINIQAQKSVNQQFENIAEKQSPELLLLDKLKSASFRAMSEAYSNALIKSESDRLQEGVELELDLEEDQGEEEEEFKEAIEDLETALEQLKALYKDSETSLVYYQKFEKYSLQLYQFGLKLIEIKVEDNKADEVLKYRQKFEEAEEEFVEIIDQAIYENSKLLTSARKDASNAATMAVFLNTIIVLLVTAISISLGLILAEKITKPILTLKNAAIKIGEGQFNTKVAINTRDELSILADAFNRMGGQLEETTVSRTYLNNIFASLSDALIIINQEFLIRSCNQATVYISGYQIDELVNKHLSLLLNEEKFLQNLGSHSLGSNTLLGRVETILLNKNGRPIPVSIAASAIENVAGNIEGIACLIQDISARKEAEVALQRQALMFETINDGVILTNLNGEIVDWNPAAESIFGYHKAEVLGKTSGIVYQPEQATKLTEEMLEGLFRDQRWTREIQFIRKDGSTGVCETTFVPLDDETGQISITMGVNRDITERKNYENKLVKARESALEAAQAKARFLANMSHEIRTPMNGVLGMSELLLSTNLTAQQLKFVQTLQVSGEHLLEVINDILDFSKLEAGEMRLKLDEFDLNLCLEEVLDLCSTQAAEKNLELALLIDNKVPRLLLGDEVRLRQILTNLVGNAIKFTNEGEVLILVSEFEQVGDEIEAVNGDKVSSEQSESGQLIELHFAVKDSGIGISIEDQKKLFESFSQLDNSSTRKYTGTGLGLAISKQLVKIMGGKIGLESELGVGSTFWFTAKLNQVVADSQQEARNQFATKSSASPEILTGKKVLVIDDRPVNRQIVQHQLTARGMEVDEAASGIVALNAMKAAFEAGKPYDIALVDMKMPRMDGSTLGRLILEEPDWNSTKLIMMSSLHASDINEPLLRSGFSDYLIKPVKESQLLSSLLKVLSSQQPSSIFSSQPQLTPLDQNKQKQLKILVVEDTPINRDLVLHQLKVLGQKLNLVETAQNGKVALDKLAESDYDIVLMDCQMPVIDGYQATQTLRQREGTQRHTVVIGMTAYAMTGDREKCLEAGMDDYLSKPVLLKKLKPVLQRWSSTLQKEYPAEIRQPKGEINIYSRLNIVNWSQLKSITGDNSSVALKLLQKFITEADNHLAQLKLALANHNFVNIAWKSHQLKGASASVAVKKMPEVAAKLYDLARSHNLEEAGDLLAELEQILESLKWLINSDHTVAIAKQLTANQESLPPVVTQQRNAQVPGQMTQGIDPNSDSPSLLVTRKEQDLQSPGERTLLPSQASIQPSTPKQEKRKQLKILVAEDTPFNRELVLHQLEVLGQEPDLVDTVENGQLALDKLAESDYDIVLMDCQMPVMDGYQTTQTLRQQEGQNCHTIVIGMTAYNQSGDREKCLEAGMDDYLSKPVLLQELEPLLEKLSFLETEDNPQVTSELKAENTTPIALGLIDWPRLQAISEGNILFQLELVRALLTDGETFLAEIKQALADKNNLIIAQKAHQIKGASASVAVKKMPEIAAQLYHHAQAKNFNRAGELVTKLEQILNSLKGLRNLNSTVAQRIISEQLVTLPQQSSVVTDSSVAVQSSHPSSQQQSHLKVLIVEDTPVNLKLVQHQLQLLNYQFDAVTNGLAALEKLAQNNYNLVLMDCQMPVMDGYRATAVLRQREGGNRHTIVIGMTAHTMPGDKEKCLTAGMDDYLSKPVLVKELREVLQQWSSTVPEESWQESSPEGNDLHSVSNLVDWSHLQEITGGNPSVQIAMVQGFIKDGEVMIAEAKQALVDRDKLTLAQKAHQIKGASASVAIKGMPEIAIQLKAKVAVGNLEDARDLMSKLEQIWRQLKASLD
ncbi:MAG: response regulator [Symploca sp. SIO2E9]|nr:response regulator [Symploca sp. SIO2E9]